MHVDLTDTNDNNPIPSGILCGPCIDLGTRFFVSLEFLLYSSAVGGFLNAAMFV